MGLVEKGGYLVLSQYDCRLMSGIENSEKLKYAYRIYWLYRVLVNRKPFKAFIPPEFVPSSDPHPFFGHL